MHNAALATLGLDWRYAAFDVLPESLKAAIEGARAMRFIGLNLTVPHKLLAVPLVDALDESARRWGAVNTIRFEARKASGDWRPLGEFTEVPETEIRAHGFNTDADAIVRTLREDLGFDALAGRSVLILGAGGAARAAALRLAAEGTATLYLVNRTPAKAVELGAEIQRLFPGLKLQLGYPEGKVDLVVNATSAGLGSDDPLPFDATVFGLSQAGAVFDMIYQPAETEFLRQARQAKCRATNGLGMLLYQGAAALELWSGRKAPLGMMRAALMKHVYG